MPGGRAGSFDARSRLRAMRDRAQCVRARGAVAIRDLVVPYRYDIVIRERMLGLIERGLPNADEALLDAAEETGCTAWFEVVEVGHFRPELGSEPALRHTALLRRIRGFRQLAGSMNDAGRQLNRPLYLNWHPRSP